MKPSAISRQLSAALRAAAVTGANDHDFHSWGLRFAGPTPALISSTLHFATVLIAES